MALVGETLDSGGVRRRKGQKAVEDKEQEDEYLGSSESALSSAEDEAKPRDAAVDVKNIVSGTYWLTRITFIRALGFLYCND